MGTPFMGEIKIIPWNFPPKGWAFCNGGLLPINQNQALFSLLGTMYGGDGQTTFALPDFRGRVPMHIGNGHTQGERGGEAAHTVLLSEMPAHAHPIQTNTTTAATSNVSTPAASSVLGLSIGVPSTGSTFEVDMYGTTGPAASLTPTTIGTNGGSQPHDNMQPYLTLNFIVALQGAFPSRN